MFSDSQKTLDFVVALAVFGLVLALWLFGLFITSLRRSTRTHKIEKRLGLAHPEQEEERVLALWREEGPTTTMVPGHRRRSILKHLDQLCIEAGWEVPATTVLLGLGGVCLLAVVLLSFLMGSLVPGLCLAAGIITVFWIYLKHCISKRQAIFERQLVDALDLSARSLRAGHPLVGAFRLIADEIAPPVSTIFLEVCQQQALGVSVEDALQNMAERSTSGDLKLFATSVIIQMRSGGNLAEMMERLAFVIRERMRLSRRVRVLTAQTQFSKRVLLALPFMIFLVLNVVNHKYMTPLYSTPDGRILMAIGAAGLVIGAWMMNRMAVLRY